MARRKKTLRRWSAADVKALKTLAGKKSVERIAGQTAPQRGRGTVQGMEQTSSSYVALNSSSTSRRAIRARQQLTPSAAACGRWGRRKLKPSHQLPHLLLHLESNSWAREIARPVAARSISALSASHGRRIRPSAGRKPSARPSASAPNSAASRPADTFSRQHVAHDLQSRAMFAGNCTFD